MATDPGTVEFNNRYTEAYDRYLTDEQEYSFHSYYENPVVSAGLPELADSNIISIGCGSGVDAPWLVDTCTQVITGIDTSEVLIEDAKREHPDITFEVTDTERHDFLDASLDLACSSRTIHYVDAMVGEGPARVYPRPLSKMIEQILNSGFNIERLVEPQPAEQIQQADPGTYNQLTKIPSFMIWVIRK